MDTDYETFKDKVRTAVLTALDKTAEDNLNVCADCGWKDSDLPRLFQALDLQSRIVFDRVNASD